MVNLLTKILALQLINANIYFFEIIKQYSDIKSLTLISAYLNFI